MSVATLTNLIVAGASLSSTIYTSLGGDDISGVRGEQNDLFEALNEVNAALSRLLPILLDPRRGRGHAFATQIDGILEGCKRTYEEIQSDVNDLIQDAAAGRIVVQLQRRLEGHKSSLDLVLAVFGALGDTLEVARTTTALSRAVPLDMSSTAPTPEDSGAAAVETPETGASNRTVEVEYTPLVTGASPAESDTVITGTSEIRGTPEGSGNAERATSTERTVALVAAVSNSKEIIPPDDTIGSSTAENWVQASEEQNGTQPDDIRQSGEPLSPHSEPPGSPNPKEIIDLSIRRSFQSRRSEEVPLSPAPTNSIVDVNIKEYNAPEGKVSSEERKSISLSPKIITSNISEQIGESSRSQVSRATVLAAGAEQPVLLPGTTSRVMAAPKPAVPISETEAISRGNSHAETMLPRQRTEHTSTETWSSTFETSEHPGKRLVRANTAASMDRPPSLMSGSTSSLDSSTVERPSDEKEVAAERSSISQDSKTQPDMDLMVRPVTPTSPSVTSRTISNKKQGAITLHAVLSKETKPPYSMNNFFVYMRDDMKALDLLNCWLDIRQHIELCTFFVLERQPDDPGGLEGEADTEPTLSEVSTYIRSQFSHPHTASKTSQQHLASIALADAAYSIHRADLTVSAERVYFTYLVPGESSKDATVYLSTQTRESVRENVGVNGRADPEVFEGVWRELEGKMEKDMFPGFMKKRRVLRHRLFKGMP